MANEKRKRQKAAREAREAAKAAAESGKSRGRSDGVPKKRTAKDVVSELPGDKGKGKADSAAARSRREAVQDVRLKRKRNDAFRRFAIIMGLIVATFIVIGFLLSGDEESPVLTQPDANYITFIASDYGTGECLDGGPAPESFDDAPQLCIEQGEELLAVFDTTAGEIVVELNTTETVGTANNFINLARSGYYDGLEFYRTDPSTGTAFSGAATNSSDDPGPGYTIPDEASGFVYGEGQLVMARGVEADSAGSAYFFTVNNEASGLDSQGNFVVFGDVTEGRDVLADILSRHTADPDDITTGRPGVTVNSVTIEAAVAE